MSPIEVDYNQDLDDLTELLASVTRRHHQKRVRQYENDVRCLKTLVDLLGKRPGKSLDLLNRVHDALGPSAS